MHFSTSPRKEMKGRVLHSTEFPKFILKSFQQG